MKLDESRFIVMGQSKKGRLLVVAFTEETDMIRILSARKAIRKEQMIYAEEI